MKEISCDQCDVKFKRKISQVLLAKKHYCSVACQNKAKKKGAIVACHICSKRVYKKNKDLLSSEGGKYFCGIKCSNEWLGFLRRGNKHPNWISGKASYKNLLQRTNREKVCLLCCEKDIRILVVHHVDQDRTNNELHNLTWLCRNCHFLVHHDNSVLNKFNKRINGNWHL